MSVFAPGAKSMCSSKGTGKSILFSLCVLDSVTLCSPEAFAT